MKKKLTQLVLISLFLLLASRILFAAEFSCLWSSYTTYFQDGIDGRGKNIELAASRLDGYKLLPGAEFSFNETVSQKVPEEEMGFAATLSGDRRVPGLGGGLCQVASTLYNAALLAGISIRERKSHSSAIGYVPSGLDATVSIDEGVDLKFQNPFSQPLLVRAAVNGECLEVNIYGATPKKNQVEIMVSKPEKRNGYLYTYTRRIISDGRKELFSEIVSRDRYKLPGESQF